MAKDYTDLMHEIKEEYEDETQKEKELLDKARSGKATYEDANDYSIKCGEALSKVLQNNVNTSLDFDEAMQVIFSPIEYNCYKINEYCESVQNTLNKQANIHMKAIIPKVNKDKIFGIVRGYVDSEDYKEAKKTYLGEPIINISQSIIDDFVRSNANYQARAGMSPKIVRKVVGKCCKWCANLAGTYDYADVSSTGNDVFRRHQYCRCTVTYIPVSGKRQNVWSKRLLSNEESKAKRINYTSILQEKLPEGVQDVTKEYLKNATPGKGKIEYEEGYEVSKHKAEIKAGNQIHKKFGGDLLYLKEKGEVHEGIKTPDYNWNKKLWEQKTCSSLESVDKATRYACKQIRANPGGIVISINTDISEKEVIRTAFNRVRRSSKESFDVMIIKYDKINIYRQKKER